MIPLSQAILLGLPEIRFTNENWYSRGSVCTGCLVGAALHAVRSKSDNNNAVRTLKTRWPWTNKCPRKCPFCEDTPFMRGEIGFFLTHLAAHYEDKSVSLEQIADYIRSIEPAEEETPVAAEEPRVRAAK